jgi:hypothetical protein
MRTTLPFSLYFEYKNETVCRIFKLFFQSLSCVFRVPKDKGHQIIELFVPYSFPEHNSTLHMLRAAGQAFKLSLYLVRPEHRIMKAYGEVEV